MTALATGLVTLAEVIASAPKDQQIAPGVRCWFEGQEYELVGTGERTATLAPNGGWEGRVSKRLDLIFIDTGSMRWVPKKEVSYRDGHMRRAVFTTEMKAARAAYLEEYRGDGLAQVHRERRDVQVESVMDNRLCGCGVRLHMRNATGQCDTCQRKCPTCGGVKAPSGRQCRKCAGSVHA